MLTTFSILSFAHSPEYLRVITDSRRDPQTALREKERLLIFSYSLDEQKRGLAFI